jgi:hypothetical protein
MAPSTRHCLDGTDWEDIARDLRETLGHLEPEAAADVS